MAASNIVSATAAIAACSVSLGLMALLDISLRPDADSPAAAGTRLAAAETRPPPPGGELLVAADWTNWGNSPRRDEYARSQALCLAVADKEPPVSDQPGETARRQLGGCNSERLLFGLGTASDPVKARHCAFIEAETRDYYGPDLPFEGRSMLMHLYANGIGVKRDLDVAMHLACGLNGAPAEMDGRILHLAELRDAGRAPTDFSFCDDITSGYAGGQCAIHEARLAAARRDSGLQALSRTWSEAARLALAEAKDRHAEFARKHADHEQDLEGTLRVAFIVEAEEELAEQFHDSIRQLAVGKAPHYDRRKFAVADARLNAAYRDLFDPQLLERWNSDPIEIRDTQRSWLRYRDAFMKFAKLQFPQVSESSIAGWLTDQRIAVMAFAKHGCSVPSQCPDLPRRTPPTEQLVAARQKTNG